MFKRARPVFYAFDIVWLDGEDLRELPLTEREGRLRRLLPRESSCRLLLDGVTQGTDLFTVVCELDLEGVVGKRLDAPYAAAKPPTWVKHLNPGYSQKVNRHEMFERDAARATSSRQPR